MRRALQLLGVLALVAVLVVGVLQASGNGGGTDAGGSFDLAAAKERLAGAPTPLAALHAESSELLPGGEKAFRARLRELRGHPVVVNKWASWCGPCRHEYPFFEDVSTAMGKTVAFVGLN